MNAMKWKYYLICMIACAMLFYIGCARLDYHLVHDAKLVCPCGEKSESPLCHNTSSRFASGHFIAQGHNYIFLYRRFSKESLLIIDDTSFEKLTIELAKGPRAGDVFIVPSPDVLSCFYSYGTPLYFNKGGARFGHASKGTIRIASITNDGATVEIDLTFPLASRFDPDTIIDQHHFHGLYSFSSIAVDKLTPWLGRPSEEPLQTTYPD